MKNNKKIFLFLLLLLLIPKLAFAGGEDIKWNDFDDVCTYQNDNKSIAIYYATSSSVDGREDTSRTRWRVKYVEPAKTHSKTNEDFTRVFSTAGGFENFWTGNGFDVFIEDNVASSLQGELKCPTYGYLDTEYWNQVCFDNNGSWCSSKSSSFKQFSGTSVKTQDRVEDTKTELEETDKDIIDNSTADEFFNGETGQQLNEANQDIVDSNFDNNVYPDAVYQELQDFSDNELIPNLTDHTLEEKIESGDYLNDINRLLYSGDITQEEYDNLKNLIENADFDQAKEVLDETYGKLFEDYLNQKKALANIALPGDADCEFFLGDPSVQYTPSWYLVIVFHVIKYVAIIILLVLSAMDFLSATASKDEDSLKKAVNKFIIRLILCVVIFLLPTLLQFILQIIFDNASMCGIN